MVIRCFHVSLNFLSHLVVLTGHIKWTKDELNDAIMGNLDLGDVLFVVHVDGHFYELEDVLKAKVVSLRGWIEPSKLHCTSDNVIYIGEAEGGSRQIDAVALKG